MSDTDFFDRAIKLVGHGYRIIPVRAGEKKPGIAEWQNAVATPALVKRWNSKGFANGNIGILTANNPAIDLDIYDETMAEKMEAWCQSEFGDAPVRVGRAPKRLLMYCTDKPFTKLFATFADARGTKHKVEVLGEGQQFVAYGVHPDTKQEYKWTTADQPLVSPADFIPSLSIDQARAMLAQYAIYAKAAGWTFVGSSLGTERTAGTEDDDALLHHKARLKLSRDQIENALAHTDEPDNYDRWIMVGMALHHQSRGHPNGLAMWHEWSSSAHNYDAAAVDSKWTSFNDAPESHTPVTFASVLKIANAREKEEKVEDFTRMLNVLRTCNDEQEIFGPIAKELGHAITADYQRDIAAKKMQERIFEITEVRPRIETIRKALAQASARSELVTSGQTPRWCKGWVYITNGDVFYNVDAKVELSERGFNAAFNRELMSEEDKILSKGLPPSSASQMALNVYCIPTVSNTVYLPGCDKLVEINGRLCANTFDETAVPPAKAPDTPEEHAAIDTIYGHFNVLFEDESERDMVLDYLAYSVQFPAEKIVWGIVMQGAEGGGKTAISEMMSGVLGGPNVGPVSGTELQDTYTGWAEGRKLVFVEEIRLHGSNRYEVLDKLKPYVSNSVAPIRRMRRDSYDVPNVTNYILFTNYWDALPLGRMDRRYYVVSTSFQTKEQLAEWAVLHPTYFSQLFDAIHQHPDVIRHWLLSRQLSAAFQPKRPAVDSRAKHQMRDQSEGSDDLDALSDLLESSTDPELSAKLLNADKLKDAMSNAGALVPYGRAFSTMLSKAGFLQIGRFRLDADSNPVRYYTRLPHLYRRHNEMKVIREIIGGASIADIPLLEEDPFA